MTTKQPPRQSDLPATFYMCLSADRTTTIKIRGNIIKMLAYMFNVATGPLDDDTIYEFDEDSVKTIEDQLDRVSMRSLTRREIDIDTLILLTNSPKCPYRLYTNMMWLDGTHYVYYRFILKRDIVKRAISMKT